MVFIDGFVLFCFSTQYAVKFSVSRSIQNSLFSFNLVAMWMPTCVEDLVYFFFGYVFPINRRKIY